MLLLLRVTPTPSSCLTIDITRRNSLSFIVKKGVVNGRTLLEVLCQGEIKDAKALTVKDGWRAMKTSGQKRLVDTTSATLVS